MNCKICGAADNIVLETRSGVPVAQNLLLPTREQALDCPAGMLDMRRCTSCGFVWNAAYDSDLLTYDASYDNDQNFSPRFRAHVDGVARRVKAQLGTKASVTIAEVGCGQGTFMAVLARELGPRLELAIGFDPAWKRNADTLPPNCQIRGEYFSADSLVGITPDLVVSRHVIEHVADPIAFLDAIRGSLPSGTPVIIETPDVDWILRHGVFFDFYYEHCSLFTHGSLRLALERTRFDVGEVISLFDGQYLIAVATAGSIAEGERESQGLDDLGYRSNRSMFMAGLQETIETAREKGPVALWGGASKGVTICLTLPDAEQSLAGVIDINERKQGCFLPCSGIPILGPGDAAKLGIKVAIVVNPAYLSEIEEYCSREKIDMRLIPLDGTE